jgi:lipid-A-disaccharide synthase
MARVTGPSATGSPSFGMVAGEASGDLLAGLLLGGMKARWPTLSAGGIGGPKMAAQGFDAWWPHDKLAVRGYVEVLRHYREISGIRERLSERLLKQKPDAFIGVDAPDFNLALEGRMRQAGIKAIHFISPSIWAWRGSRMAKIRAAVDHVLCVFPFEPALYEREGVSASYVGHPLADAIPLDVPRGAARTALGLGEAERVVAVLPGSRRSEIAYIAPRFLAAVAVLHARQPDLRFLLPIVPGLEPLMRPLLAAHAPGVPIDVLQGRSHEALAACDVALVGSGTATLEAALYKRPMVIAYNMHWLSWQMMKRMKYQPWVGLPNILLRDFVVPELLQEQATPENLATAALDWLQNPARAAEVQARFHALHLELRRNTAKTATDAIAKILNA